MLPLETPRLVLRHFRESDAGAFFDYRNDAEVARWQSWENITRAAALEFVGAFSHGGPARPGEWFQIAVADRATDELLGDCALRLLDENPSVAEIGFTFARAHQGKGYAFEAVSRLIEHLFQDQRRARVIAVTDVENVRSWRMLERLGMTRDPRSLRSWLKGRWADEYGYTMSQEGWLASRRA